MMTAHTRSTKIGVSNKRHSSFRMTHAIIYIAVFSLVVTFVSQAVAPESAKALNPDERMESTYLFSPLGGKVGNYFGLGPTKEAGNLTQREALFLAPVVPEGVSLETVDWSEVSSQALPTLMKVPGYQGHDSNSAQYVEYTKIAGGIGSNTTVEWCPVAKFDRVGITGTGISDTMYFQDTDGKIVPLTYQGEKVDLTKLAYVDIVYAALSMKGTPVGISQEAWDSWKSRFYDNGDPSTGNILIEDIVASMTSRDDRPTVNINNINDDPPKLKFLETGKTLYYVEETNLVNGSENPTKLASLELHQQLTYGQLYGDKAVTTITSYAKVTPTDSAFKPFEIQVKPYKPDEANAAFKKMIYDSTLRGRVQYAGNNDIATGGYPGAADGTVFRNSDFPYCHPENVEFINSDEDEARKFMRNFDTEAHSYPLGFDSGTYGETVGSSDTNKRNRATFPLLAHPIQYNPGAGLNNSYSYTLTTSTPQFLKWVPNTSASSVELKHDKSHYIAEFYSEPPPKVKIEKYTLDERDPEKDMQVGTILKKENQSFSDRIESVQQGTEEPWSKGPGEDPKNEGDYENNSDGGRHTTLKKAHLISANPDQDGPVKEIEIGFDIINVQWGSNLNNILITDEQIKDDLMPKDWQTHNGEDTQNPTHFTCEVKAKHLLYEYRWGTKDDYNTQYVPNDKKTLPVIQKVADGVYDPNESLTEDTPIAARKWKKFDGQTTDGAGPYTSQWNPNTGREELFLSNINLKPAQKVDGSDAATKLTCKTKLKISTDKNISVDKFAHHNKVTVDAQASIPVIKDNLDNHKRKPTSWSHDADNWWARVVPAEIDIMSQITHGDKESDRFFRHDFGKSVKSARNGVIVGKEDDPNVSKPINEYFRVSAGYQKREQPEHLDTEMDLQKIRLKPQVLGTPAQV
ncbi:MAG: hypothetical protein Q4P66_09290, partial [Actinomycetaceae bacterium]|nr:hypothetical protein [Actinomycetaceae bacterium]